MKKFTLAIASLFAFSCNSKPQKLKVKVSFEETGFELLQYQDSFDTWKGQYFFYAKIANRSNKDYNVVQLDGILYENGKEVGRPTTGNMLKKEDSVVFQLQWICPQTKPDSVHLSINKEMLNF